MTRPRYDCNTIISWLEANIPPLSGVASPSWKICRCCVPPVFCGPQLTRAPREHSLCVKETFLRIQFYCGTVAAILRAITLLSPALLRRGVVSGNAGLLTFFARLGRFGRAFFCQHID